MDFNADAFGTTLQLCSIKLLYNATCRCDGLVDAGTFIYIHSPPRHIQYMFQKKNIV